MFAFYGRRKTLLAFIVVLFVAEIAAQITIIAVTVPSIDNQLLSTLDVRTCVVLKVPSLYPSLWYGQIPWNMPTDLMVTRIPSLVFESLLFALVAVRFVRTLRLSWMYTGKDGCPGCAASWDPPKVLVLNTSQLSWMYTGKDGRRWNTSGY